MFFNKSMARRRDDEPTHARVWLMALLEQHPEHDKGQLYVDRFSEACDNMVNNGTLDRYELTGKNSEDDQLGVDAKLQQNGKQELFQITSSLNRGHKHIRTQRKHPERPEVHTIYVRQGDKPLLKSVSNLEREIGKRLRRKQRG